MKTQVRKNILSNKWEVQVKETLNAKWQKVGEFASKEEAEKSALTLANSTSGKLHKSAKKNAQGSKKTAKKSKSK